MKRKRNVPERPGVPVVILQRLSESEIQKWLGGNRPCSSKPTGKRSCHQKTVEKIQKLCMKEAGKEVDAISHRKKGGIRRGKNVKRKICKGRSGKGYGRLQTMQQLQQRSKNKLANAARLKSNRKMKLDILSQTILEAPCPCPVCLVRFPSGKEFAHHVKDHFDAEQNEKLFDPWNPNENGDIPLCILSEDGTSLTYLVCKLCLQVLETKQVFLEHMNVNHPGSGPGGFLCTYFNVCSHTASSILDLISHLKGYHGKDYLAASHATLGSFHKQIMLERTHRPVEVFDKVGGNLYLDRNFIGRNQADNKYKKCAICFQMIRVLDEDIHRGFHIKMELQRSSRPFECPLCLKPFRARNSVRTHFISVHMQNSPFTCRFPGCGRRFGDSKYFMTHITSHSDGVLKCRHCGVIFSRRGDVTTHSCVEKRRDAFSLERRGEVEENELPNVADLCKTELTNDEELSASEPIPDGVNLGIVKAEPMDEFPTVEEFSAVDHDVEIKCELEQELPQTSSITFFPESINGEWDINKFIEQDPVYIQLSKDNPEFAGHILRSNLNIKSNQYKCRNCDVVLSRHSHYKQHEKSCLGITGNGELREVKLFETPVTASSLAAANLLCKLCGYFATSEDDKLRHMNENKAFHKIITDNPPTNQRPTYSCPYCNHTANLRRTLASHIVRFHGTHNTFECDECNVRCKTRQTLRLHKETAHCDERDRGFRCEICKKYFGSDEILQQHVESTGHVKQECPHCPQIFKSTKAFRFHLASQHGDNNKVKATMSMVTSSLMGSFLKLQQPKQNSNSGRCPRPYVKKDKNSSHKEK